MSRSLRAKPSPCYMRSPHHARAEKQLSHTADDLRAEGIQARNRKPIPPNAWDDLIVSYWRGQAWNRKRMAA